VLAFNTAGPYVCAAVLRGPDVLAHTIEDLSRGQAERLMPLLEETLAATGVGWDALDLLGVGIGPGNFTGIRISVAAARGLALALERPAIGVSGLDAQAADLPRPCLATVAARRGGIYVQLHDTDPGIFHPPALLAEDALNGALFPRGIPVTGDGAEALAARTGGPVLAPTPLAIGIARLALLRADAAPGRPTPLYLRAADAAPARDRPPPILE
jgi:tRNA threonylcarbamoyl adenosine modification protein YeaZ